MNTTTATRRNALLTQHGLHFSLPAENPGGLPPFYDGPEHDFLVLNQRPDLTAEACIAFAPAVLLKT